MSAGTRRRARWYALQVLYALDMDPSQDPDAAVAGYVDGFQLEIDPRALPFGKQLVAVTTAHRDDIDQTIQTASRNWRIERMSRVDRNILRLATAELHHIRDAPMRVIINEAVELAKRFGASESAAFVNGILDRIAQAAGHHGSDAHAGDRREDEDTGEGEVADAGDEAG